MIDYRPVCLSVMRSSTMLVYFLLFVLCLMLTLGCLGLMQHRRDKTEPDQQRDTHVLQVASATQQEMQEVSSHVAQERVVKGCDQKIGEEIADWLVRFLKELGEEIYYMGYVIYLTIYYLGYTGYLLLYGLFQLVISPLVLVRFVLRSILLRNSLCV